MRWYKDRPDVGDMVVVRITDIDKNSAYADLEEYEGLSGLIHISEVSRSWVQDVSKEIDEGEKTVAQVIEDEDGSIALSLKRVKDGQKREAMSRWKKEQKAESFVEDLADRLNTDKEDLYEKAVFPLQKEFGTSFRGFELAVGEEERLKKIFDDEDLIEKIQDVARDNINLKQEKLEGEIELTFLSGDGVKRIKEVFEDVGDGVEVKYVSAPKYSITAWGRNQEMAKDRMDEAVDTFRAKAEELDGEFEFSKA